MSLTHLVFADDLMIFTRGDLPSVKAATDVLHRFSQWSGLTANLEKTEVYFGGVDGNLRSLILDSVGMQEGSFPFRYLGIPINSARLTRQMYDGLVTKIHNLAGNPSIRFLSYAGKAHVLNSVVFGLSSFWCFSLLLPKHVTHIVAKLSRDIFWGRTDSHRKFIFKGWQSICVPWNEGGFNIKSMDSWNKGNMLRWLWQLDNQSGAIWVHWVGKYYLGNCSVWDLQLKDNMSESLRGILSVRNDFISQAGGKIQAMALLATCTRNGQFSQAMVYELIRRKLPSSAVFAVIHKGIMIPRHRVTLMLAVQGKLATIDILTTRGLPIVNRCSLCKMAAESVTHLFFQCTYSASVLCPIKRWMKLNIASTDINSLLEWAGHKRNRRHWRNGMVTSSLGSLVNELWSERNRRVFEGREIDPIMLVKRVQFNVSTVILSKCPEAIHEEVLDCLNS